MVSPAAIAARQQAAHWRRDGRLLDATHDCTLLRAASPARKGAKQWCRMSSGLLGGPALRSYSKRRAKGSADLSAGRTRLRVRFTVPGPRCPHVSASGRPRERKHTRTGRLRKKCTVMASIGSLVSDRDVDSLIKARLSGVCKLRFDCSITAQRIRRRLSFARFLVSARSACNNSALNGFQMVDAKASGSDACGRLAQH